MSKIKKLPAVFAAVGIVLALSALFLSLSKRQAPPVMLSAPQEAADTAEKLMDALSDGDFAKAETLLYGMPSLGADREAGDEVGQLIWAAFIDALDYRFTGDLYATDTGLARNVSITTLDITSVTETLRERSEALLEQRVEQAEDVSQIYDENNDYREDFVMDVLYDAAAESLEEDARYLTQEVTLNVVFRQGQWWVLPSQALLQVISGGTAG